ncbi:hypothetical protein PHYSODRAFT_377461, partial [Phytophthora sojae]
WNVDNATENGPSSLQVLLMWLLTPGNYERLHSKQRNKAISSILSALKKNGIHHRSESSIRSKVSVIENQYLAAKRWLDDRAMRGDNIVNGSADADSEAQVLALCPHFIELFPELRHSLVVRDPNVQLIHSDLQRQVAEIKLEHVKKESKAVLENDDKMRAAMLECDIEVKRERGQVQLLLEKVLARQTMKKEGVPNEEIDSILPL